MENYIMLDGKKIEIGAELAEMLAQAVKQEPKKVDPFARQTLGEPYYRIDGTGTVLVDRDDLTPLDAQQLAVANYCTDKELMGQRALHETLNRLLWRYSEQHGGDHPWNGVEVNHFFIFWDLLNYKWRVMSASNYKELGVVYFKDTQTAEKAIEEIVEPFVEAHPEFRW